MNLFQRKEHLKTLTSFSNKETMQPLSHFPKQEFRLCFSLVSFHLPWCLSPKAQSPGAIIQTPTQPLTSCGTLEKTN